MKQIYRDIQARVMGFINSNKDFLLLKLPVGSGKTTNVLLKIEEMNLNWIYLAPFHTNITENLELSIHRKFNYLHLKSRAKECQIDMWRELAEKGVNIRPICENRCTLKETSCPYYAQREQLKQNPISWAGVHHHIPTFLKDFIYMRTNKNIPMRNYYDILVIDENPIAVFFINEKGNAAQLSYLKSIIRRLPIQHKDKRKVIKFINYLALSYLDYDGLDYDIVHDLLDEIDFEGFYEEYQIELLEAIVTRQLRYKDIPKDFIEWFTRIKRNMDRRKIENMIVKKNKSAYTSKNIYFMCYDTNALSNIPFKIIGLDGTADIDIWSNITNKTPSVFDKAYEYRNIYQLTGGEYPLASWVKPGMKELRETGKRLCRLIDNISERKKEKVLIICTKALERFIRKNTKASNLIYGNYYYLRSRNDFYIKADTVILACQPNIPQFQIECFSKLSDWEPKIWRKVFTDEEMIQGVGRIREDLAVVTENKRVREKREAFIFPSPRTDSDTKEVVDIFGRWSTKMSYNEMMYFLDFGDVPHEVEKKRRSIMLNMIPKDGIYKTYLLNKFTENTGSTHHEAWRIFKEIKNEGLIDYARRKKVYKRDSN